MTWRYVFARDQIDTEDRFTVRELYTDHETGALSWSTEPIAPHGETWAELADDLIRMEQCFGQDMLDLTLDPPALVKPRRSR